MIWRFFLSSFFIVEMFLVSPQTYSIRKSVCVCVCVCGLGGVGGGGGTWQELSHGRDRG